MNRKKPSLCGFLLLLLSLGFAPVFVPDAHAESKGEGSDGVMTPETQRESTPAGVLAELKKGNERFVRQQLTPRDYNAQALATASGQYPKAVILSCIDSRVPPELVFDQGIGDLFVGRVAGNFENVDLLGSFEFATKVAGAKLIVVLGHSSCGAIKGAADGVELGNLTAKLQHFDGALEAARASNAEPYDASNAEFISAAIEANVRQTMKDIVDNSAIIAELVKSGDVAIVGGVYELSSGRVLWLDS